MSDVIPIWRGLEASRAALLAHRQPDAGELTPAEAETLSRLFDDAPTFEQAITRILQQVRDGGDEALREISAAIDGAAPDQFKVSEAEFAAARDSVPTDLLNSLQLAADRVRSYHELQLQYAAKSFSQDGWAGRAPDRERRPLCAGHRGGLSLVGAAHGDPCDRRRSEQVAIASPAVPGADGRAIVSPLKLVAADIAGVPRCLQGGRSAGDCGAGLRHRKRSPPLTRFSGPATAG